MDRWVSQRNRACADCVTSSALLNPSYDLRVFNEDADATSIMGRAAHRARPLSLARRVLPRPVPDRPEDQPVAHGGRAAALRARARSGRRLGRSARLPRRAVVRELRVHRLRLALSRLLSQEPRSRRGLDAAAAPDRFSARLRHRAGASSLAAGTVHAGRAAVLDVVPHSHLRLGQYSPAQRSAQPGPAHVAHRRRAADMALHRYRGLYRHGLFLSAVHGAADLRHAREDGREPDRGRRRSRLSAVEGILADHAPAGAAGRDRRRLDLLHPDRGRVRHSRPARRLADRDDRPDAVDRVLRQPGLAGRFRRGDRAARSPAGADRDLSAAAGARSRRRALTCARRPGSTSPRSRSGSASSICRSSFWSSIPSMPRGSLRCGAAGRRAGTPSSPATAATVLGTLAAIALTRFGRFRGRMLFAGMVYAPLVMPEVITGLSLLLLFVAVGVDRGFWTIAIAHTTVTACFATVVVQSRLISFDVSLEEAAMDLGCPPLKTFLTVTLPLIAPALASGWMLAFTLSLDDLVIASFTTGPGATTLPIRIYSEIRLGVKPEINAVCTIMVAVVAIGVVAASLLAKFHHVAGERAAGLAARA